ncbi:ATR-interacting protein mus304-like [Uranotaenia lowii]|uniref:ATR-interacting protein mus304-like n=1 Tax=Uranotaenia lowii TaxID=190385 RepID=UPI002478E90B|nr:ATR-interacting protein mus304-like [Uranotaenia lowii]
MASKRFGNFQPKQPSSSYKRPKLDIEMVSSQQYNSNQQAKHLGGTNSHMNTSTVVAKSAKSDYLWGDDDDEFIILASQKVEEVELFQSQMTQSQHMAIPDVSFGRFCNGASSSTQHQQQPPKKVTNSAELMPPPPPVVRPSSSRQPAQAPPPAANEIIDLLTDGDDDIFSEQFDENYDNIEKHIDEFFNNECDDDFNLDEFQQNRNGHGATRRSQENLRKSQETLEVKPSSKAESKPSSVFKPKQPSTIPKPVVDPFANGHIPASQQCQPPRYSQKDREALINAAKKKDHAKDLQVNFLTKQLDMATKKMEQLQKDYNEVLERIQCRDGEASMLRYELKNVKSQNDQLRLEKMKESETMKKEWIEKVKDLEKVIVAQKSELEFKTVEMMNLKTRRMSHSFRSTAPAEKPVTDEDFKIYHRQLVVPRKEVEPTLDIDVRIFDLSAESISKFNTNSRISNFSKGDAILSQHLGRLQSSLSQLVYFRKSLPELSIPNLALVVHQALEQIFKYCNRLKLVRVKDAHLGPKVAFDFLNKNSKKYRLEGPGANIYQKEPISYNEEAVIPRRFLAALGLLCRYEPSLAVRLLRKTDGRQEGDGGLNMLGKALVKISYASNLYDHIGFVTAAASIVSSLSHHINEVEERSQIVHLFKCLIYCRPDSSLALTYLSEALYRIALSNQSVDLLNQLCWRSKADCFTTNDTYRMIQFKKDSCTLQIYAVLLETSVPQNRTLNQSEREHLVINTRNTIYFLRNSLARPVRWVRHFFHRNTIAAESSSRTSKAHCQCHIRITNAFVVLFHQLLRCWSHCPLNVDFNIMIQLTQNGVLLLFDLFQTAYRNVILQIGGHAIQCRLQAAYNLLVQHQNDFRFQAAHKTALRLLDLRLVMDEPLKSSDDEEKMDTDEDTATSTTTTDSVGQERRGLYDDLFEGFFSSKFSLH